MKRLPKDIRKYCRDQRFVYTYRNNYEEITINFRITNIAGEYNDKNPLKTSNWEDININIVVDGTASRISNGCITNTRTLTEYFDWELRWNPRSPRTKIRRMIGGGAFNSYTYGYGTSQEDKGQFDLFLKCMNLYNHRIKLKTIKFGKV
jgi:hypothetical protein